jgi:hypothetical protein
MNRQSKFVFGAVACAVLAGASGPSGVSPAHALAFKECKSQTLAGRGRRAVLRLAAQNSARKAWRGVVSTRLGHKYSYWIRAEGKRYDCAKSRRKWTCWAMAKPCTARP